MTSAGVAAHDLGLLGYLARAMQGLLSHGVDVIGSEFQFRSLSDLPALARAAAGLQADVVVLEIPVAVLRQRNWQLWHESTMALCGHLPKHTQVVLAATGGESTQQELIAGIDAVLPQRVHVVGLPQGLPAGRDRYAQWGLTLAEAVTPHIGYPLHWSRPEEELDTAARQRALQTLPGEQAHWQLALQRLVDLASAAYGTEIAALSLHAEEHASYIVTSGPIGPHDRQRRESVCTAVLGRRAGLILRDAAADDRFIGFPMVADGRVRFYAGYRIHDPAGTPIGVVCVTDSRPRDVVSQDIDVLRDIAAVIERRVWELGNGVWG